MFFFVGCCLIAAVLVGARRITSQCFVNTHILNCFFYIATEESRSGRRTLDEDEVRLDELLDDLALEEAPLEADVEGPADGAEGAAASPSAPAGVFAFEPTGMKFV